MRSVIFYNSENIIKLLNLRDGETGSYINDASVIVSLFDVNGSNVTGETWPKTMTYVTGSNGQYKAVLTNGLSLTEDAEYEAVITASDGTNDLEITMPLVCRKKVGNA